MKPMTEKELLEDTVKYYSENPLRRCITVDEDGDMVGCAYSATYHSIAGDVSPDSEGCAIGRFMTENQCEIADDIGFSVNQLPKSLIPERLAHFNIQFLADIQALHDDNSFWDAGGLTSEGRDAVAEINQRWVK